MNVTTRGLLIVSLALAARAHADDQEVDIKSFEYVDVVETADGSIWKGVIVEQEPGVQYKIATADGSLHVLKAGDVTKLSKQKNRDYHRGSVVVGDRGNGLDAQVDTQPHGGGLPAPFAQTGTRLALDVATIFPTGDARALDTSVAPTFHGGYELMLGNVGLEGGGMIRYTYWRIPGDTQNAAWTLETHAYVRAALHISRVAFHAGMSAGLDTNLLHAAALGMSTTATGLGMNLETGIELAATPALALGLGFGYHPATDTIADGAPQSMEYFALTAGATMRL